MLQRIKENFFLILVISITIGLRLIRLSELFHFTYDESVFAFIGKRMIINHHIPLIGGVTPFHVHLSPFFYWLSAFFLYFSKLNPSGWGVVSALISGFTVFLLYVFVKETYSRRIALISVILYSFSISINIFDRHYWGLFFNPCISILILFSLLRISQKKYLFFLLLGLVMGFAFHTDPSTSVFLPLIFITLWKYKIPVLKIPRAKIGLGIFLVSFLPLIIFDLRHNFVNIRGVYQYVPEANASRLLSFTKLGNSLLFVPNQFARAIFIPGKIDLAEEYSYCQKYVTKKFEDTPLVLLVLSSIIILAGFFTKPKNKNMKVTIFLLNTLLISVVIGIVIYAGLLGRPFFDHYLTTLIPLIVIFTAIFIDRFWTRFKLLSLIFISLFITLNLYQLSQMHHRFGFSLTSQAIRWSIAQVNDDFALDSLSNCFRYNGYRYLYYLYGKEPVKSFVDQNFFWLYDQLPGTSHPKILVVMVAGDYKEDPKLIEKYQIYKSREIKSQKFGDLEVMITDNTQGIFYDF